MQKQPNRDNALDAAKAIAISLVLIWHLQPFSVSEGYSGRGVHLLRVALALFYHQVSLIAVPLFILVSLYLLHGRLDVAGQGYANHRIRRLAYLFTVWTTCQFVCFYTLHVCRNVVSGRGMAWPQTVEPVYVLLMTGGPELPFVGGSVFYFLFSLICLSALLILGRRITPGGGGTFSALTLVVLCLCYFQWWNWEGKSIPYWRIDNFVVYVPVTFLIRQNEKSWNTGTVAVLAACFFIFAVQDEHIRNHIGDTGAYSRPSVVFGSVAIFSLLRVFLSKCGTMPRAVTFLATYSLGLFAIHKYWKLVVRVLARNSDSLSSVFLLDSKPLFEALACVALTCVTVYALGRTRLRSLVR